ncbi:MAG: hypothetical protein JWR80_6208, partial [Bradyrhizobium sp.]|nr:hypothetical protein [Bradyrhizobium sp.]
VAEAGYNGLMRNKRVVVPGIANKVLTLAVRLLPRRMLLRKVAARQNQRRKAVSQGT